MKPPLCSRKGAWPPRGFTPFSPVKGRGPHGALRPLLLCGLLLCSLLHGADLFVTSPAELASAFAAPSVAQPGDTVWIRGGTYTGTWVEKISGSNGAPITFRAFGRERVILDGGSNVSPWAHVLTIAGSWTTWRDIEFRHSADFSVFAANLTPAPAGINVMAMEGVRVINCTIHDTGQGLQSFAGGAGLLVYGCTFYHCGASPKDHAVYAHNQSGLPKIFAENVLWGNWDYPIHFWGSADVQNLTACGNILWNNAGAHIIAGGSRMSHLTFNQNCTWFPRGTALGNLYLSNGWFGDDPLGHIGLTMWDNYLVGGGAGGGTVLSLDWWHRVEAMRNTVIAADAGYDGVLSWLSRDGYAGSSFARDAWCVGNDPRFNYGPASAIQSTPWAAWSRASGIDTNGSCSTGWPTTTKIFVRPNQFEKGRGHVVIYNWAGRGKVEVDLSTIIERWKAYELRPAWNLEAPPLTGIWRGLPVTITLTNLAAPLPGTRPLPPIATRPPAPDFIVLQVREKP